VIFCAFSCAASVGINSTSRRTHSLFLGYVQSGSNDGRDGEAAGVFKIYQQLLLDYYTHTIVNTLQVMDKRIQTPGSFATLFIFNTDELELNEL
jgi:hypothetical protein